MDSKSQFISGKVLSGRVYPEFFPSHQTDTILNVGDGYAPQAIAYKGHYLQSSETLCREIHRILKPGGQVLVTFPATHDTYTQGVSWFARNILRRKSTFYDQSDEWHSDNHNQEYPITDWLELVEKCGFEIGASRATTLFPPLHLYGVPWFWFSNNVIHAVDAYFSQIADLKNYDQALMVIFRAV